MKGACLEEAGIIFTGRELDKSRLLGCVKRFSISGQPDYEIDFASERNEFNNLLYAQVSQFTYLRGLWRLEAGKLSGSGPEHTEAYTGGFDWADYIFEGTLEPQCGMRHNLNFRVQGAIRSYAVGLAADDKLALYKNNNGYKALAETAFSWECGGIYRLRVSLHGGRIQVYRIEGGRVTELIDYLDARDPYLRGQIGASAPCGHCHFSDFSVSPNDCPV